MKKILGVLLLGLLLSGCGGDSSNFSSQVLKENKDFIILGNDPWSDINGTTLTESRMQKNIASNHCSKYTDDKITQAKQICRDLGFKDGTGKFSDCALKMMSIQFEATNKVASSSGGTTQEIIVKHQNDYDIFDAMIDVSNSMLSNNKKSSSSSSNRGTNCVIGRTNPTFGTTTMNCR